MLGRVGLWFGAAVLTLGAGSVSFAADWGAALGGDAVPRRMTASEAPVAGRAAQGPDPVPGRAIAGGLCELSRADRARTASVRCMACHDGAVGGAIEFHMGPRGTSMSHPVEMSYEAIAARQPERYEARAALPPEVPLVEGKVACTSCHDGASRDPKHVAIPVRLCQSCHRY
jgi:hypothetical protein